MTDIDVLGTLVDLTIDGSIEEARKRSLRKSGVANKVIKELEAVPEFAILDNSKSEDWEAIDNYVMEALRKVMPQVNKIETWEDSAFLSMLNNM